MKNHLFPFYNPSANLSAMIREYDRNAEKIRAIKQDDMNMNMFIYKSKTTPGKRR